MPSTRDRMIAGKKTHHRPRPSLQSTQGIDSVKPVSGKRTPNRWCGCGVRASLFPVPDDLPHHARRSPAHRSPRSLLFSPTICDVTPGTTDARLPGQGRHGGRSQDTDAGDAMVCRGTSETSPGTVNESQALPISVSVETSVRTTVASVPVTSPFEPTRPSASTRTAAASAPG